MSEGACVGYSDGDVSSTVSAGPSGTRGVGIEAHADRRKGDGSHALRGTGGVVRPRHGAEDLDIRGLPASCLRKRLEREPVEGPTTLLLGLEGSRGP
ncbi:hypothetical protein SHIRM173S_02174 [Streptomyces hirsutus]